MRYVALLRGINVGGKNKLPMKDLVAIFEELGCGDVTTYIQSGNMIFETDSKTARGLSGAVQSAISDEFGYEIPVILRSKAQLVRAVSANPFDDSDDRLLGVGFLADKPSAARVRALDYDRSPPDELRVVGSELFLYTPNGVARTKFTNVWLDKQLATTSTMRNWRTTQKLVELVSG